MILLQSALNHNLSTVPRLVVRTTGSELSILSRFYKYFFFSLNPNSILVVVRAATTSAVFGYVAISIVIRLIPDTRRYCRRNLDNDGVRGCITLAFLLVVESVLVVAAAIASSS